METSLTTSQPRIGVLALQGDYEAHAAALTEVGAAPSLVKTAEGLAQVDALVLPGGESTTMLKFLHRGGLLEDLRTFAAQKPVFGTCAGAILLAREVRHPAQDSLAAIDISVERNAYGDQRDSAILTLNFNFDPTSASSPVPLETVFIRAPRIVSAGAKVQILAYRDGFPILVRQNQILAATFHPELSNDRSIHRYFLSTVCASNG
jgi:5'-phosphate synthase pdxT subunit